MSNQITVLNSSIRQLDNLYSLNDLHRASGAEDKHSPFRFMRNEQTKELISELNSQTPNLVASKIIRGGTDLTMRGYWVCEELALAYATWISPKFHLVVLRAFLAMRKQQMQIQAQQLALPEPELKYARELPKEQWLRFASLWFALHNCIDLLGRIEKPLNALGSPLGTTAYSYASEYKTTLGAMKRVLEPMLAEFEADPYNEAHYHLALTTLRQYQLKGLGRQLIL